MEKKYRKLERETVRKLIEEWNKFVERYPDANKARATFDLFWESRNLVNQIKALEKEHSQLIKSASFHEQISLSIRYGNVKCVDCGKEMDKESYDYQIISHKVVCRMCIGDRCID